MSKMKRSLSMLLALVLVLAMIPATAGIARAETAVSSVTLFDLEAPVAGNKPDYSCQWYGSYYQVNTGVSYTGIRNGIQWYDDTTGTFLNPETDTFKQGRQYTVRIYLKAVNGSTFGANVAGTLNGKIAKVQAYSGAEADTYRILEYAFDTLPVEMVSIDQVDTPIAGNKPDYQARYLDFLGLCIHVESDSRLEGAKNGIRWHDLTDNKILNPETDVFVKGHTYLVEVFVRLGNDTDFAKNPDGTNNVQCYINGRPAAISTKYVVESYQFYGIMFRFDITQNPLVSKAEVTLDAPELDKKPDYAPELPKPVSYIVDADLDNGYIKDGVCWYDETTKTYLTPDDAFKANHQYTVYVYLRTTGEYDFATGSDYASLVNAKVNGKSVTDIQTMEDYKVIRLKYTFETLPKSKVTVSGKVTAGVSPATVELVQNDTVVAFVDTVDGVYTLKDVQTGFYTLEVSKEGYLTETLEIEVESADITKDFELKLAVTPMHRLYNPNTGEHFYTGSEKEKDTLVKAGWQYEGVAWNAPTHGGLPIHRLFNPNNGDHHYTGSEKERDNLVKAGWQYEGVAWNTPMGGILVHRLFNPNADCGSHHYTTSIEEVNMLKAAGWQYEGVAWNGVD